MYLNFVDVTNAINTVHQTSHSVYSYGQTGPPGCLALARWAGWSAGHVGRHVKCWRRERNGVRVV